ncbi:MAG: sugar kinase [Gemmatimonadetes bacterium]|nr:sugar kinase [Gemmatimonadota bacterium]MCH7714835.1 sugar kinase [Gemmatimonadota bacterium]
MGLLVVGSIALDSVETPFGSTTDALGGSATFFAYAAAFFHPVQVVGVVGDDFPSAELDRLAERGVDLSGVEHARGASFRWKGRYSADFQNRETLDTQLGVFATFEPKLPEAFRRAKLVFLGNIDPTLQSNVLDQTETPDLVVCDTMNYWIQGAPELLLELMKRIDVLMVNDSEARQLSGDWNVYRSARWILDRGPKMVIIKQGEYGAFMVDETGVFCVPGYPLEEICDPTGAGDAFAGGFMGHLGRTGDLSPANMRRAMVFGSTTGSFAVERFSVERFLEIGPAEIAARARAFADLVHFDTTNGFDE